MPVPLEMADKIMRDAMYYNGNTKSLSVTLKNGELFLVVCGGGSAEGYTNVTYGGVFLVHAHGGGLMYGVLHEGSGIAISTNGLTFSVNCSATTIQMGYVKLGQN